MHHETYFRPVVIALLWNICAAFAVIYGVLPSGRTPLGNMSSIGLLSARIGAFAFAAVGIACTLPSVRRSLVRLFPRLQTEPTQQEIAFGLGGNSVSATGLVVVRGFDPGSMVHTTAMIYCILLFGQTVMRFVLAGGLDGLVALNDGTGIQTSDLLSQMSIFILIGAVGVGLGARRNLGAMVRRLGLQIPTANELVAGAGMAALCYGLAIGILFLSSYFSSPEVSNNESSGIINDGINTMLMAFLISMTAAVGEEIAFRGALQPVFGLYPTSLLFALVHIQYTLTPASFVILIVGVGLGWLRLRFNTTTAIVAHFLYNFGQLFLLVYLRYLYQELSGLDLSSWLR